MKYQGKFVFVQNPDTGEKASHYEDGEYFCFRETPNVIHCVKLSGVYETSNARQFTLIGALKREVIDARQDDDGAEAICRDVLAECDEIASGRKEAAWVGHVYEQSKSNALAILRTIGRAAPVAVVTRSQVTTIDIEIRVNGVPLSLVVKERN